VSKCDAVVTPSWLCTGEKPEGTVETMPDRIRVVGGWPRRIALVAGVVEAASYPFRTDFGTPQFDALYATFAIAVVTASTWALLTIVFRLAARSRLSVHRAFWASAALAVAAGIAVGGWTYVFREDLNCMTYRPDPTGTFGTEFRPSVSTRYGLSLLDAKGHERIGGAWTETWIDRRSCIEATRSPSAPRDGTAVALGAFVIFTCAVTLWRTSRRSAAVELPRDQAERG
jgi:hypothetical protein